eukprot:2781407-Amphidinium_carterae.1
MREVPNAAIWFGGIPLGKTISTDCFNVVDACIASLSNCFENSCHRSSGFNATHFRGFIRDVLTVLLAVKYGNWDSTLKKHQQKVRCVTPVWTIGFKRSLSKTLIFKIETEDCRKIPACWANHSVVLHNKLSEENTQCH